MKYCIGHILFRRFFFYQKKKIHVVPARVQGPGKATTLLYDKPPVSVGKKGVSVGGEKETRRAQRGRNAKQSSASYIYSDFHSEASTGRGEKGKATSCGEEEI